MNLVKCSEISVDLEWVTYGRRRGGVDSIINREAWREVLYVHLNSVNFLLWLFKMLLSGERP